MMLSTSPAWRCSVARSSGIHSMVLVYGQNTVVLEFRPDFESFSLTPNQRAAGKLLDQIGLNLKAAEAINFLFSEPGSNIPGDLEKISPEGLTAFYEIS